MKARPAFVNTRTSGSFQQQRSHLHSPRLQVLPPVGKGKDRMSTAHMKESAEKTVCKENASEENAAREASCKRAFRLHATCTSSQFCTICTTRYDEVSFLIISLSHSLSLPSLTLSSPSLSLRLLRTNLSILARPGHVTRSYHPIQGPPPRH